MGGYRVGKNIIMIEDQIDVKPFLEQLKQREEDWKYIAKVAAEDPHAYGGDLDPPGFLPLTMGVEDQPGNIKNSEILQQTELYEHFTTVHDFWKKWGFDETCRAAFFKLKPNGVVGRHIDDGQYYVTKDRYHLSLQGTYQYIVGDESFIVEPGKFFWFNNKVPHQALSIGSVDRVSLVFDAPHKPTNPQHNIGGDI